MLDLGLRGRRVLVAGAGRGIGRAGALAFAEGGAVVACLDLDDERGRACRLAGRLRSSRKRPSPSNGDNMGDKSPKSKQRSHQQKNAAKAEDAAAAKSKQESQSRAPKVPGKGKR